MKRDPERIQNDIVINQYSAQGFIEMCNLINQISLRVYNGYTDKELAEAEAECEHYFCEFIVSYMNFVAVHLISDHDYQQEKNSNKDKETL